MKTVKKAKPAAAAKKHAAKPVTGKVVALKSAGDLAGPFKLSPAALAAKTPAALRLNEGIKGKELKGSGSIISC